MQSFKQRSYQKELLDGHDIPFAAIEQNMRELDNINRRLGGHAITLKGVKLLLTAREKVVEPVHIVEIGCGGGDNLRAIKTWTDKQGVAVRFTGVDINRECIQYAKEQEANRDIRFICSDYKQVEFDSPPAIIFSSLFCHHFTEEELLHQLCWMNRNSTTGFFINDLHRHRAAFYSIKLLTRFFSKSYLVKNDAPLSVQRGFRRKEWQELFREAGIESYTCSWQWAFRWLIVCSK